MLSPLFGFNDTARLMDSLERQMDRVLVARPHSRFERASRFTLRDNGAELVMSLDAPGVTEKDVDITLEGDVLTLRAESRRPEAQDGPAQGYKLVRSERSAFRVYEQIELPVRVDGNGVQASLKDGVLTITLPKAPEAQPRKIAVNGTTAAPVMAVS